MIRSRSPEPRVMAAARPSKISVPARADVAALSKPDAFERWNAGVRSAGQVGENVITMYDVIGEDFWSGGGVTVNRVDAALRRIGSGDVEVHINSPGGDMFEGIAIYNRLLEHPGKVTVKVLGLAASAASIIAMAGAEVLIGPASFLMIHDCWVLAVGNRHDMAETAAFLEPFDDAMAGVYAARTGQKKAEVAAWMDAETWMNGETAIQRGFADGLLTAADLEEDPVTTEQARAANAARQAEIALCRSGSSRTEARTLVAKIKGAPSALVPPVQPAGDLSWLGAAAELTSLMRSSEGPTCSTPARSR
jgi:ATP-dependent protease ClpP protease subunit